MFEVIDISPGNLGSSLCFIQSGISHNALVSHDVLCRVTIYSLMYSFLNFEPVVVPWLVLTSFMTCIQASQEAGKVVWYSQLFKNFPHSCDPHSQRLSVQFSSVTQSCPTLCDPTNRSTPGLPVHHQLPESTQTHVH